MPNKAIFSALVGLLFVTSCSSNTPKDPSAEEKKAEIYYSRGTSELVNKEYASALTYLTQAKEFNPNDSKIRNNLGMAYFFRDQLSLAEAELKAAIDLDPKNTDARLNLGSLYLSNDRLSEARVQFDKVQLDLIFPNQFRNYYNLAMLSLKEGDRRGAFDYLAKSIKEKEDYCPAHYKLGELYAEEYKFKQALESFMESGKGTCVSEPAPYYQQALALLNLNRTEEAKKKFEYIAEKFSTTKFASMASIQLKKINANFQNSPTTRATQVEVIRESQAVESPNF